MKEKVYTFNLLLDWNLLSIMSQLDRFDGTWASLEKKEGHILKQLKLFATIKSVGASTRIEGSKMSDEEVEALLNKIDISKLEDRDSQEVMGYFNVLEIIANSFNDIDITETNIQTLHNQLLKHSEKDIWHKGKYKKQENAVEATFPDGSKQIIFRTTAPGISTEDAMRHLVEWYNTESEITPLVKIAAFVYDFLSIHPFQDGNGRLSRLLATLLLLKSKYSWIQYVSFEHEIENNKKNYYKSLRNCQAQRPNEDITEWIVFFFESLLHIQRKLEQKLNFEGIESSLSPKEKVVYSFVMHNPGCKSGVIAQKFQIPSPSVKRILTELVAKKLIEKHGNGAGTNYSVIG